MDHPEAKILRPELLKILCILTFVGSGFSLFSYVLLFFYSDLFMEIASSDQFTFFRTEEERNMIIEIFALPGAESGIAYCNSLEESQSSDEHDRQSG